MLKRFYPDDYVDSAYEIPYEELYKKGYRGIVFDVDNTLVEHGAPVTERAAQGDNADGGQDVEYH